MLAALDAGSQLILAQFSQGSSFERSSPVFRAKRSVLMRSSQVSADLKISAFVVVTRDTRRFD